MLFSPAESGQMGLLACLIMVILWCQSAPCFHFGVKVAMLMKQLLRLKPGPVVFGVGAGPNSVQSGIPKLPMSDIGAVPLCLSLLIHRKIGDREIEVMH